MNNVKSPTKNQMKIAKGKSDADAVRTTSSTNGAQLPSSAHGAPRDVSQDASVLSADSTLLDIVAAHRPTEEVFRSRDAQAGECILCNALFLTVHEACAQYGLDLDALMADLKAAARGEDA